jgi:hypothetical protein
MYLTQLRALDVSHTNWPTSADAHRLTVCFDIVDATLNSWVEAHTLFNRRQRFNDRTFISVGLHQGFTKLVVQAMQHIEDDDVRSFGTNKFPSETLAYALIKVWLAREAEELCLSQRKPAG